ncbi:MAG: CPBP family intramembrane metalloprotease [Clostridiales bacterium]|nr:CPBP family intramembrane metalloprotease [Clostridiales bacterium]
MKRVLTAIQGLLMALAAIFTVSFILTIIKSTFILATGLHDTSPEIDYCLMVLAVMISIILFYLWYRRFMLGSWLERTEPKKIFTLKNIGIFLMIGIGCQLFAAGVLSLIKPLLENLFAYYDETMSSLFAGDPIVVAVYVIILAPVVEELMIRGIMYGKIRQGIPFMAANLLQAAVFGIYHMDFIQGIYTFAIGLLLGYIYEKAGTLLAPIVVHIIINGSGVLLDLPYIGPYIPIPLAIAIGAVLLPTGIILFRKNNTFNKA